MFGTLWAPHIGKRKGWFTECLRVLGTLTFTQSDRTIMLITQMKNEDRTQCAQIVWRVRVALSQAQECATPKPPVPCPWTMRDACGSEAGSKRWISEGIQSHPLWGEKNQSFQVIKPRDKGNFGFWDLYNDNVFCSQHAPSPPWSNSPKEDSWRSGK